MKKCPKCEGFVLYDDETILCPRCDSTLIDYQKPSRVSPRKEEPTRQARHETNSTMSGKNPPERKTTPSQATSDSGNTFESADGRHRRIRGNIAEITAITRYQTRWHKVINSLLRREPYQLGYSTHSVRIRVEERRYGAFPENVRDIIAMGDYEGKLFIGSDISIQAVQTGERLIARHIYLHDSQSVVRPGFQIPAWIIRGIAFLVFLMAWIFISSILDGSLFQFIGNLLMSIVNGLLQLMMPIVPFLIIGYMGWSYLRQRRN